MHSVKRTENTKSREQALWTAIIKCKPYHTFAAHWFMSYAYQAHTETLLNAQTLFNIFLGLGLLQTHPEMFRFLIYCIWAYPSMQTGCYPVNKLEISQRSSTEREYKQLLSYNSYSLVSVYSYTSSLSLTCVTLQIICFFSTFLLFFFKAVNLIICFYFSISVSNKSHRENSITFLSFLLCGETFQKHYFIIKVLKRTLLGYLTPLDDRRYLQAWSGQQSTWMVTEL